MKRNTKHENMMQTIETDLDKKGASQIGILGNLLHPTP